MDILGFIIFNTIASFLFTELGWLEDSMDSVDVADDNYMGGFIMWFVAFSIIEIIILW